MLLLLSYSDMNGVGPGVWSEWKGNLLWDLYERARLKLTGSETPSHGPVQLAGLKEKVMNSLHGQVPLSEVDRHLALLPDRYLRTTKPEAGLGHFPFVGKLQTSSVLLNWR